MAYASFEDVQLRFFRELTPEEQPLVEQRLADAENKIRRKIKDLDTRILDDPAYEDLVRQICADAVIRLVRNPEGYIQETDGNYTYQLSQASADGRLTTSRARKKAGAVRGGAANARSTIRDTWSS